MAELQNFRSAFHGFNREDVVHYIEYINNQHNTQVNQLNTQLQALQADLENLNCAAAREEACKAALAASEEKCAALEAELEALRAQLDKMQRAEAALSREAELAAYRRAERAERAARDRVSQMYDQANGALADATAKVDGASAQISDLADQITEKLSVRCRIYQQGCAAGRFRWPLRHPSRIF